jgi:hypothetical protein
VAVSDNEASGSWSMLAIGLQKVREILACRDSRRDRIPPRPVQILKRYLFPSERSMDSGLKERPGRPARPRTMNEHDRNRQGWHVSCGCWMNMVDDASGDTLAHMGSEETIWAAAGLLRAWVKKYGIPVALYTDWKNVYVREASTKEQLQGVVRVTQFGQMCQRLGIRIMAANSPQAQGRVERNHGTHQDRLVKKMRLKKIQTHAEANRFLEKEYLPEHNRRFRRTPAQPENCHRAAPRAAELEEESRGHQAP